MNFKIFYFILSVNFISSMHSGSDENDDDDSGSNESTRTQVNQQARNFGSSNVADNQNDDDDYYDTRFPESTVQENQQARNFVSSNVADNKNDGYYDYYTCNVSRYRQSNVGAFPNPKQQGDPLFKKNFSRLAYQSIVIDTSRFPDQSFSEQGLARMSIEELIEKVIGLDEMRQRYFVNWAHKKKLSYPILREKWGHLVKENEKFDFKGKYIEIFDSEDKFLPFLLSDRQKAVYDAWYHVKYNIPILVIEIKRSYHSQLDKIFSDAELARMDHEKIVENLLDLHYVKKVIFASWANKNKPFNYKTLLSKWKAFVKADWTKFIKENGFGSSLFYNLVNYSSEEALFRSILLDEDQEAQYDRWLMIATSPNPDMKLPVVTYNLSIVSKDAFIQTLNFNELQKKAFASWASKNKSSDYQTLLLRWLKYVSTHKSIVFCGIDITNHSEEEVLSAILDSDQKEQYYQWLAIQKYEKSLKTMTKEAFIQTLNFNELQKKAFASWASKNKSSDYKTLLLEWSECAAKDEKSIGFSELDIDNNSEEEVLVAILDADQKQKYYKWLDIQKYQKNLKTMTKEAFIQTLNFNELQKKAFASWASKNKSFDYQTLLSKWIQYVAIDKSIVFCGVNITNHSEAEVLSAILDSDQKEQYYEWLNLQKLLQQNRLKEQAKENNLRKFNHFLKYKSFEYIKNIFDYFNFYKKLCLKKIEGKEFTQEERLYEEEELQQVKAMYEEELKEYLSSLEKINAMSPEELKDYLSFLENLQQICVGQISNEHSLTGWLTKRDYVNSDTKDKEKQILASDSNNKTNEILELKTLASDTNNKTKEILAFYIEYLFEQVLNIRSKYDKLFTKEELQDIEKMKDLKK